MTKIGKVQRLLFRGVWTSPMVAGGTSSVSSSQCNTSRRFLLLQPTNQSFESVTKVTLPKFTHCSTFATSHVNHALVDFDPKTSKDEALSEEDWQSLKEEWKQNERLKYRDFGVNLTSVVKRSIKFSKLKWGKSLLDHAKKEIDIFPLVLFNLYCYFCSKCNDLEGIEWCVETIRRNNSMLDQGSLRSLMNSVCQRDSWKADALELLEIGKDLKLSPGIYEPLVIAACNHKDVDLVTNMLSDMRSRSLIPSEPTCLSLFSNLSCNSEDDEQNRQYQEIVFGLLKCFRTERHYVSKEVAVSLKNWFTSNQISRWKTSLTRLTNHGNCKACNHTLEMMKLTSKEFEILRKQVTEKVIYGDDIFQKTRPDEFEAFTHFVKEGGPYDIVVDGLNVAHLVNEGIPARMLRQVIVYLVQECGYKCLVLGRRHMLDGGGSWQRKYMKAVTDLADCFFTENISQDDPFMLYATLHSGPRCMYMTRDMLRDHKARLDPQVHLSFIKWQRTHQMTPVNFINNKLICKPMRRYDTVIQATEQNWHIPFENEDAPRYSYQVPIDWLCAVEQ